MRVLETLTMAAIVASLLCPPLAVVLGVLSLVVPGLAPEAILTFGGALHALTGLLTWWAVAFAAAIAYAAIAMPQPD